MSCPQAVPSASSQPSLLRLRSHPLRVALVGNANVGKSALFGWLTGRYATVSNYPGTTVTVTRGRALVGAEVCDIIDTPGVNALEGHISEDEAVTRRLLTEGGADVTVQVADALETDPYPAAYRPVSQAPFNDVTLVVRTVHEPEALAAAVRREVWTLDQNLPVSSVQTMREMLSASTAPRRFQMMLLVTFAALSLALAAVGIYGVVSYSVARRTREIGLRMALGARQRVVLVSVLTGGVRAVVIGLALGLAAATAAATSIRALLFGVEPLDPASLAGVALVLLLTAALACYLPARRAARVDPVIALQSE